MNNVRKIDDLELYADLMGETVTTPVLQIGSGAPHVGMVALQHGWEVIGLDTGLQILRNCVPKGTLTLISVASPIAYQTSNRITAHDMSPSTKQPTNMNRVHPGDPTGNLVERSANAIDEYIKNLNPDIVIDLHSYANQSVPHCIVDPCEPALQSEIETWMEASQNNWYKEYSDEVLAEQALDNALSAIWVRRGVKSVTIELGPLKTFSPDQSAAAQQALRNLLISCSAIEGAIVPQIHDSLKGSTWQRTEIIYSGNASGYLRVIEPICSRVNEGDVLAEIVTPDGKSSPVNAPTAGVTFIWPDEYRILPGSQVGVMLVS